MVRRFKSSGLLRHVDWYIFTDVSEARTSSIIRVNQSKAIVFGLLGSENGGIYSSQMSESVYQSTWRNMPEHNSSALLSEPQISQIMTLVEI
jgi:hypothetical protein